MKNWLRALKTHLCILLCIGLGVIGVIYLSIILEWLGDNGYLKYILCTFGVIIVLLVNYQLIYCLKQQYDEEDQDPVIQKLKKDIKDVEATRDEIIKKMKEKQ